MNDWLFYAVLAFGLFGLGAAGALYFGKMRLKAELEEREARLQAAEARAVQVSAPQAAREPRRTSKKARPPATGSDELVPLRKEAAKQRDLVAQLRRELQGVQQAFESAKSVHFEEVRQLVREREELLAQLMAADKSQKKDSETLVSAGQSQIAEFEGAMKEMGKKVASLEKRLEQEKESQARLKADKQEMKSQLWRFTSAAKDFDGKPLDPVLFRRWKDRALTARVQYKMMKQLREMSDIKLSTYQDSVVKLANFVFESTGSRAPRILQGEVKSDRYLAQALSILHERNPSPRGASAVDDNSEPDSETSSPEPSSVEAAS